MKIASRFIETYHKMAEAILHEEELSDILHSMKSDLKHIIELHHDYKPFDNFGYFLDNTINSNEPDIVALLRAWSEAQLERPADEQIAQYFDSMKSSIAKLEGMV